jgi:hypothetical protein
MRVRMELAARIHREGVWRSRFGTRVAPQLVTLLGPDLRDS